MTDSPRKPMRHSGSPVVRFETVTLALLGILLPLVTIALVVVRGLDPRSRGDLEYRGALEQIEAVMAANGPGLLARPVAARLELEGRPAGFDTLVAGDSTLVPSLRKGGFLHDQIDRHNAQTTSRAIYSFFFRSGSAPLVAPASLLQVTRSDGADVLSGRLNPGVLEVPSPFSQDRWRAVVTADHTSRPSLVGTGSLIGLVEEPGDTSSGSLFPGRDCAVKAADERRYLLYCYSRAGLDVDRGYDLALTFGEDAGLTGEIGISSEADRSVWVNGERVVLPATAQSQDIVHQDRVGSFIVSTSALGVLAKEQWINGRSRMAVSQGGTVDYFGRAGRADTTQPTERPRDLSLRARFSAELEEALRDIVAASGGELVDASGIVAELGSGEVLAVTQVRPPNPGPIRAFEPLLVGSVVKPVVAAAILSQRPELAGLRVQNRSRVARVHGVELARPFSGVGGCRVGVTIDFTDFLACSSNTYAAELVFRGVLGQGADQAGVAGGVVPTPVLEGSALSSGLFSLYRDANPVREAVEGRSDALWTASGDGLHLPPSDLTLHPWESRPWFVDPESRGLSPDLLARYAFGGWENRWTLVGLTEAYARIATGREVELTLDAKAEPEGGFPAFGAEATAAFQAVRRGLRETGRTGGVGTAAGVEDLVRTALGDSTVVLLKTGTLNEPEVKLRALAFAMGRPTGPEPGAPLRCGVVGVFRFDYPESHTGGLSSANLDFLRGDLLNVLEDHWAQMGGCS